MPIPEKVSLERSSVAIDWSDGHLSTFTNKALREACPCALCAGEPSALGSGGVVRLAVAAPEGVFAKEYRMVGRYAIAFAWSDGHSSGIYPYPYLIGLCQCADCASRARDAPVGRLG